MQGAWSSSAKTVVKIGTAWLDPAEVTALRQGVAGAVVVYLSGGQQMSLPTEDVDDVARRLWER